jgi:resuscitation-promoting factor RpfA
MREDGHLRRVSIAIGALVVLVGAAALLAWSATRLAAEAHAPGVASFDALLGLAAAGCAAACLAWLAIAAILTVVGSLPGMLADAIDRVARRIAPGAWRRTVQLALGVALAAGPIGGTSAWADEHAAARTTAQQVDARAQLPAIDRPAPDASAAALPPIDRPTGAVGETTRTPSPPPVPVATPPSPLVTGNPRPTATVEEAVVVRRGDTLWHIAARHLGSSASAAEIAAEWPRWWNANRNVIGADPDLILPGQVLRPPA